MNSIARTMSKPARAALCFSALGLLLAVAFFPLLFNHVTVYDDEGFWLVTIRQFLHHGSLYVNTLGNSYGPFYYSFTGAIYRVIGQNPTLLNGRLLVLAFTTISSGLLAATVWRVTHSLLFAALCQVATFCTLILVAGNEPMSPGSIIALVLSVLVYALSSYSVEQRNRFLVVAGAAAGALTLIKVNIGIFAVAGLAVGLVVGNSRYPRWFRITIGAGSVLLPFVLMFQKLSVTGVATFALLVGLSMLGICAVMSIDAIALAPRGLIAAMSGFGGIAVVSVLWPLFTGTSPDALFTAVFVRPLQQVNIFTVLPFVGINLFAILITALAIIAVSTQRNRVDQLVAPGSPLRYLAVAAAALLVIELSLNFLTIGRFGAWLPAIVLLPALALLADVPPPIRLALRLTIPIAVLQVMHAYPVAGSQTGWATFLVFVPCTIALAAAMQGLHMWREARPELRRVVVGSLCFVIALASGLWPVASWVNYGHLTPLHLPGAQLVRLSPSRARELRTLTRVVKKNCDTFYSVPGLDSLYIYSGLPTPTGQLANWPNAMTRQQERQVASDLRKLQASGHRVCIVRDLNSPYYAWGPGGSEANRPIGRLIQHYTKVIASFGPTEISEQSPRYSVSIKDS